MNGQISLWSMEVNMNKGDYVMRHGQVLCHIMRPAYIGKMIVYDCSTQSHTWFRAGILEDYIPYEDTYRSIIDVGERQRILLTHRPGIEIYEVEPWDFERVIKNHANQ